VKSADSRVRKIRFSEELENMSVEQAAYATVHEAGAKAVAATMGVGYQVLLNKVNPNNTSHHLSLVEAVELMRVTGDTRIIEALANEFCGTFFPVPELASGLPPNLVSDLATISANFGALMREVAEDLVDGVITRNEVDQVESQACKLRVALTVLLRDLHSLNGIRPKPPGQEAEASRP
jgi:hypothetical protein